MRMRALFGPTFSAWIIPVFIAFGGLLISIDQFRFAELMLGVTALWVLGWLWYQPYRSSTHDLVIVIATILTGCILGYCTEKYKINKILSENDGLLSPANDQIEGCLPGPDFKTIIVGGVVFSTNRFPIDIIQFHDPAYPEPISLLSVDLRDGNLGVSTVITSGDNRVISELKNNRWIVNPNNILSKENQDFSSLSIIDQFGNTALNIRFANPKIIEINKISLRYKNQIIVGDERGLYVDDQKLISGVCTDNRLLEDNGRKAFIELPVNQIGTTR